MKKIVFLLLVFCGTLGGRGVFGIDGEPTVPLTISFVGDIMAHQPNFSMDDYNRIYAGVRDVLGSDDVTFANLEAPVNDEQEYASWPRFNVQRPYVEAAIAGGVDFFSLANNHSNDWGYQSVAGTQQAFAELGALTAGSSGLKSSADDGIAVTTVHRQGWALGVIAVTQFVNSPGAAAELVQVVDYSDPESSDALVTAVERAREGHDIVVVSYHGGVEYVGEPQAEKRELFLRLVDAGADIVWGHHPHVLQPWEIVERDVVDGGVDTECGRAGAVVMYSLGNFISAQTWFVSPDQTEAGRAATGDSVILQVRYQRGALGGACLDSIDAVPISNFITGDRAVVVRTYADLLAGVQVSPEWLAYYQRRYQILQERYGVQ